MNKSQAEVVADQRLVVAKLENELSVAKETLQWMEMDIRGTVLRSYDWDIKRLGPNEATQKLHKIRARRPLNKFRGGIALIPPVKHLTQ